MYGKVFKKRLGVNWSNCKLKNKESTTKLGELIQCGSATPYCIACLDGVNLFICRECMAEELLINQI